MKKTYYTVEYSAWGANGVRTAVFDSKEKAYEFYNSNDYRDKPVAHNVSSPKTIKKYDEEVAMTDFELNQ